MKQFRTNLAYLIRLFSMWTAQRIDPTTDWVRLRCVREDMALEEAYLIASRLRPWARARNAQELAASAWSPERTVRAHDVPLDFDDRYPYLGDDYGKPEPKSDK